MPLPTIGELLDSIGITQSQYMRKEDYPFVYAKKFLLEHPGAVPVHLRGVTEERNPETVGRVIEDWAREIGEEPEELAKVMADAYMLKNCIVKES